jgi:hypothetical protein
VINILFIVALFITVLCLIVYIILKFRGYEAKPLKAYLFYILVICMLLAVVILFYNYIGNLITNTSNLIY